MTGSRKTSNLADDRPQYAQIRDRLRDRIVQGEYAVGALLPTESELCVEFKISRHTVREALRRLTDAGLIQRRQGLGSRVLTAAPHPNYVHAMRSLDQLFQYASDTRFMMTEMEMAVADPAFFPQLALDETEWLIVRGLRLERDEDIPICATTVIVNRAYSEISDDLKTGSGAIYRQIEDRFGVEVSEVVQDITVTEMSAEAAKSLGKTKADVAVQVRRQYLGADGTTYLASINYHPADRFSYTMQLRREGRKGSWG